MKTKLSLFCEKIIEAGWLAAVVAVPLFFNIYTARTFEPDKLTLMRSIAAVMLLAWVIKLLEEHQPAAEGTRRALKHRLKQPMVLPTLAIVTAYIISTALSLSPKVSLWGSYQRLQGSYTFISYVIIFALMAMTINRREQIERFITTAILASVPVALYGIIQHNGLDPLPWAGNVTRRVASNMGNAIFVSSYLIMVVPLTLSRLIASMKAIITEDDASWGYTVLSAIYIFVLAIQILTIIYSISRGPQIGLLASVALMGLLLLLQLRRQATPRSRLTIKEVGQSLGLVVASAAAAGLVGGLGYLAGRGIESALLAGNLLVSGAPLTGAIIGGLIGFAGTYTYFAATGKGWRWLWVSWPIFGVIAAAGILSFLILLNTPGSQFAALTENNAYLRRMAGAINTESGTGKVRVLIWEGALKLISPHEPLGVEGEYTDGVNAIRPLVGYGPESMFNAFAFVYPPDLAHVENRGSSADRSHNETIDSLVMTGVLGWLAFYFLMSSLFYFGLKWLGWVPNQAARWRLIGTMAVFSVAGLLLPYFLQGSFTMSALGLPFGLYASLFVYLVWQAFIAQPDEQPTTAAMPLTLIGLLGAFAGHFLEVHFVFSIAATYTYFWSYLGLMVVLSKIKLAEPEESPESAAQAQPATNPPPKSRRRRKGRRPAPVRRAPMAVFADGPENWDTWLGSLGLAMAIILIILTFDFVPVQFDMATGRYSLLWMVSITYLVGVAIAMADTAVKQDRWQTTINWGRGILLYAVTSMGYAGFYVLLHSQQRHALLNGRPTSVLEAANGLVGILYGFYIVMFILFLITAAMLNQKRLKGLPVMRSANWWLYPPLALAVVLLIFFKNLNVVKADLYLKEGERYRSAQQWDNAIALHQESINVDSDEDFYYLMLALDYQLQAQDRRLNANQREQAWQNGEETALAARNINKYNPDNTGNMGRYYFTLGQLFDVSYYDKALNLFKAAIDLAPQNVQYYNLLAQVYYIKGDFDTAIDWLNKSVALDAEFAPTWLQLGDTYAAKADIPTALDAHTKAIMMDPNSFADANFDSRVNFYISAGQTEAVVMAFQQYLQEHTSTSKTAQQRRRTVLWAIGHTYARAGNLEKAQEFLQQSIDAGYTNYQAILELADVYLTQENFPQAEAMYQQALTNKNANQPQIYSSLGFIYARTGRLQEAINANLMVVQAIPNDYDSNKNLALLYQQTGDIDQALVYAQKALELAPDNSKADLQAYIEQLKATQVSQ